MTAPLSEPDFLRLLREHGCEGRKKGSEFAVYRKSDDQIITGYAVSHRKGSPREVKPVYIKNFLKRIKEIEQEELAQTMGEQNNTEQSVALPAWQQESWYQEKLAKDKQYESTEEKP